MGVHARIELVKEQERLWLPLAFCAVCQDLTPVSLVSWLVAQPIYTLSLAPCIYLEKAQEYSTTTAIN